MNRVGFLGRGESVWLGWFLCRIVSDFAPRARARQDAARARRWEDTAQGWAAALEHHGWDGQWYRRAFFDDGQMLGSASNAECRIDLIAQAWAVLSDLAPPDRQAQALDAAHRQLVDPDTGLLALLTPPFAASIPSPGYIQAYPAGVRENGGQYNHAGAWAVMAQAQAHRRGLLPLPDQPAHSDLAYRYFTALSCAHQASSPQSGAVYGLEPYAMAGDVYTQAPYAGRGGWSWYTGAAGWMHQAAIASLFGLDQSAETIQLTPCLPQHWNEASITLVRGSIHLHFMLVRADASKAMALAVERGASLLGIAEPLAWTALPKGGRFLVALPPATPA
jgi:cyclic beta-1,2-glucan synthetase